MSDVTMIKEGQSPGKYSKTVPARLLLLLRPPVATQFMPEIRQRRICGSEVKYGRGHERVMV